MFYTVFLFLFTFITANVLFGGIGYSFNILFLFGLTVLLSVLLAFLFYGVERVAAAVLKYEVIFLTVFLGAFFFLQLFFGSRLRFESAFDFAAVYKGAVQWSETGSFADYYEYYHYFPNNLGAMTLLSLFFRLGRSCGITDYFMLGVLLNSLLLILTMLFTYLSAKKIIGPAGGLCCLVFFAVSLPFYFLGAAFYTDSLSMLFPVLFYYLFLCFRENAARPGLKRRALLAAMGVTITLGSAVKFTVMIMAAAVLLELLVSGKIRQACLIFICIAACFAAFQTAFDDYLFRRHLDREQAAIMNTPISHWIMMGLNPNSGGAYHPDDYTFTRSFTDVEARNEAISDKIKERIRESGPDGLTRLFSRKLAKAFGDGTYAISDFLDDAPYERGALQELVLYDGTRYSSYKYVTQTVLLAVYFYILRGAAAGIAACRKGRSVTAPFIAAFGLILFLALWESSSRYFLNFIPVLFLCAAYGACGNTKGRFVK